MNIFRYLRYINKLALLSKKLNFENNSIFNCFYPFSYFLNSNKDNFAINKIKNSYYLDLKGDLFLFSSARMGIYFVLKPLLSKTRPFFVVPAFTCGVVANSVIRAGFTPLYIDVDINTLGTSFSEFRKIYQSYGQAIRGVVVQHSFGIPAQILDFVEFAKGKDLFILEDCATTLGSKVNGITCGNFGDASVFSFDSTKPLSIGTAGLLSVNNKDLAIYLTPKYSILPVQSKREYLYFTFTYLINQVFTTFIPSPYFRTLIIEISRAIISTLCKFKGYNEDWTYDKDLPKTYHYPSRLHPAFIFTLDKSLPRITPILEKRRKLLTKLSSSSYIHPAYKSALLSSNKSIVPLRILISRAENDHLSQHVDDLHAWFKKPLQGINSDSGKNNIRYKLGTCPTSEKVTEFSYSFPVSTRVIQLLKDDNSLRD